ncbi:MAG: hypothetical protein AAF616_03270 [Bacteroidota bacterium]
MNPKLKKGLLTHGLIILAFFVINLLVHYPAIISGLQISQHDILQGVGGNHQLKTFEEETGEQALWNPYVFSGMPAYLTGVEYSGDLLKYVYIFMLVGLGHPSGILFVAMVSFYIMLLCFKVRPIIAAIGAVAFGLNGFNVISIMAGHNAKIAAVALMPLVLAGVHLTFSGKRWLGAALTALALGLEIRANHPQITYYLALIILAYGINELVKALKQKNFKPLGFNVGILLLAALLSVGANFGRLGTTLEYSKYTIRGKSELKADRAASSGLDKEYAFRYSNGIAEPLFLFVPNIFGGSSQQALSAKSAVAEALKDAGYNRSQIAQQINSIPTYWGEQPLTAPYFAGTISILLLLLGLVLLPKDQKVWLIVLAILGILMSYGKNFSGFNELVFNYLPGYNKFRSVTFTIIITIFSLNLLGSLALEKLVSVEWSKKIQKQVLIGLGVGVGFLVALLLLSGALSYRGAIDGQLPDWFASALRGDRKSLLIKDTLRALFFASGLVVVIWAFVKKKAKVSYLLAGLLVLVIIDHLNLTTRFLGGDTFKKAPLANHFKATEADQILQSSTEAGDRVLNLQNPWNENRTSYYHASIGGYHGAKIRRYQDLIDYCLGSEVQQAIQNLQSQSRDFKNLKILNMLNTTHFYAGAQRNGVFANPAAYGEGWIVNEIIKVNSADEEISKVCEIDTKAQAVVDVEKFQVSLPKGAGDIVLEEKTPNKITYTANVTGGMGLGVFSEVYYPEGWVATIDGNPASIIRANYVLRALEIPEGSHKITFEFKPRTYFAGNSVMMVCSILIILLFGICAFLEIREVATK